MVSTLPRRDVTRLALVLGILTAFGPLSIDMYLPGLPQIARELGADSARAQLTLGLFFIGLALAQIFFGPLSDRIGRRRPLLFGCALYALASFACCFVPSIELLIALRFVQALGGAAGMVLARSVVRDLFDERGAAQMLSLLMLVMGLAPITAPMIGGQVISFFGWRAIFGLLGVFGLLCLAMVLWALPESLSDERRVRAGLGQVFRVYGRLLVDRRFVGYALAGGMVSAGMFAYISGSSFVFIEHYGLTPSQFSFVFGGNALGLIMASQLNRRLLISFRGERILHAALLVYTGASLLMTLLAATGFGGMLGLIIMLFFCIASIGMVSPNATAAALAPHGRAAGSASALLGALQFSAGAAAGAVVGALINQSALPMAAVIAACGIIAYTSLRLVAR